MGKRIPDRWRDYSACTWIPVKNERIISFKTPLAKKFDHEVHDDDGILESERFTPTDLVTGLAESDLSLGLVIDFTFTKRYYNPQEFNDQGILYTKMMCPGKEIPVEKDVKRFEYEVHSFLEQDKTGKLVGVHCTHGVNRTGYMVCRYLIDCQGYKPEDAIEAFKEARGYPIERENYLEDLKSRTPSHGVDFIPDSKDCHRASETHNFRERVEYPSWRQRDSNSDLCPRRGIGGSNWRHSEDRHNFRYSGQSSWQPTRRDYDDRPLHHPDIHGYQGSTPQYSRNYRDNDYYDRREFENKNNFRGYRQRNVDEQYSNDRYQAYQHEGAPQADLRRSLQRNVDEQHSNHRYQPYWHGGAPQGDLRRSLQKNCRR